MSYVVVGNMRIVVLIVHSRQSFSDDACPDARNDKGVSERGDPQIQSSRLYDILTTPWLEVFIAISCKQSISSCQRLESFLQFGTFSCKLFIAISCKKAFVLAGNSKISGTCERLVQF